MSFLPLGLLSWLLIGLGIGLTGYRLLPGGARLGGAGSVGAGLAGSLGGGLLATWLGFGGFLGYDLRSLAVAALGGILVVLLVVIRSLRPENA